MTKDEALSTARRLLERAGPHTELLISAEALEALVEATRPPFPPDTKKLDETSYTSDSGIFSIFNSSRQPIAVHYEACLAAQKAYAEYVAKPKTKKIDVWHVEYVCHGLPGIMLRNTREEAERTAYHALEMGDKCVCITGPHSREVPA